MILSGKEIKKRLEKGWESEDKLAVIEADKLLDDFLKRMGYKGESLGERLKQLDKEIMPNLDRLWDAHNIRGDIVHDPGCRLDHKKAKEVIDIYEQAFDYLREV